jgi:hypothetical protein
MTLINGWAECPKIDRLYLTTMNSFGAFLSALKEETRTSVIPPENKVYPKLSWSGVDAQDDETDIQHGGSTNGSLADHAVNGRNLAATAYINGGLAPAPVSRNDHDKGYGLADGPWMYRLPQVENQPKPDWASIRNQSDYMKMLDAVRAINKKYEEWKVKECCTIIVIHVSIPIYGHRSLQAKSILYQSQDLACHKRLEKKKKEEKAWSKEMAKELKAQGFYDSDDDNDGESWYDWWSRNDTLEREAERKASQQAQLPKNSNQQK